MTFKKKFNFKKINVIINLSELKCKKKNIYFFGSPLGLKINDINENNIIEKIKDLSGHYFVVILKKSKLIFLTDPFSNFRVYYKLRKNKLIIFNNLKMNNFINKLDKKTFNFFLNKNYTPGHQTFFENLYKFQPCSIYEFDGKFKKDIYFEKVKNKSNFKILKQSTEKYLDEELIKIKNLKNKNILLFSGGKDSCLLFQNLVKNKINFVPVYFHTQPETSETLKNLNLAKLFCDKYDIKIKIITIDIKKKIPKNFFKHLMFFEYHISLLHFFGIKQIKKIYGKKTTIITGQSCDSILSFGPSQYTLPNLIARTLIHYPESLVSKFFVKVINYKFKKKIFKISNLNQFYSSFYYSFYYYLLLTYQNKNFSLEKDLKKFIYKDKNKISSLMYLKCHGFLQGPDNLVLINSARYFKIQNIIMPYASYRFTQIVCKNYNFALDVVFPKYIIDVLLDNYFIVKLKNFIYKKKSDIKLSDLDLELKHKHLKLIKNEIK